MADKRADLLDASERRIRRGGYEGFSFREIASDVGIRVRAFSTTSRLKKTLVLPFADSSTRDHGT